MKPSTKGLLLEMIIILVVAAFLLEKSIYISIVVVIFHLFFLLQKQRTRLLVGNETVTVSVEKKIRTVALVAFFCIIFYLLKGNMAESIEPIESMNTLKLSEMANGDLFPYLISVSLLSSLLILGISVERRRR